MDCYFGTFDLPAGNDSGKTTVVSFYIPEIGVRFKAPFNAVDCEHSHWASLLALLEFIDSNQKYFENHTFRIYGNNLAVINRVNGLEKLPPRYAPLMAKTVQYREKYRFSLDWIPTDQNSAIAPLFD